MAEPLLRLEGIGKSFGPVTVLDDINLDIAQGEVLGILGENGAGKSTLLKIISGIYTPSVGRIHMGGNAFDALDPISARRLGVAMIPQEFNLVATLKVYENVFLGQELRRGGFLDHTRMRAQTRALLDSLEVHLDPNQTIERLSVAQKQMVEVARVLVNDARVVILDEPTTVLTSHETAVLFRVVKALVDKGVTVLFISHKLREVKALCDRLLILRDGRQVEHCAVASMNEEDMARKMVGRELAQIFPDKPAGDVPHQAPALAVRGLCVEGVLHDIDFEVHRGEILGLAGLVGAGRTEIAETIMGLRRKSAGELLIDGEPVTLKSPRDAHARGLAYLSEDRQGKGLQLSFNVMQNVTDLSLARYVRGLIRHGQERKRAEEYQARLSIKAAHLAAPVGLLSGGNQQKVYFAKLLDIEPDILLLDEPTRGIDISAKQQIYRLIRELTAQGKAVVVISSELEEIIGLADRALVIRQGRVAATLEGDDINEERIMLYAAGAWEADTERRADNALSQGVRP
ncbi:MULTISPECIES: sugar ABC transporter ATP-binding protein [unclassified Halomonas]|uniref:sugar ABC transporter ATP-binding protein n=1 Tax=unclassified Halomonas TaxID=2609666 RepID=UPI0021E4605C|nr:MULTISPECIES: sugar ABC transporter ATP-binding protein [unclassified Halomonas]UYF99778.1 sugar ABC transporter ATP-binding protein [Halomonas sp. GD1P12]WNL42478.1 sugar ABC transporter ATP-binding protein [Halomonas sp. PAMB 3264]